MLGLDILGFGHKNWPVDWVVSTVPEGWAIGCFDKYVFGRKLRSKVKKLCATGRYPFFRIQCDWQSHNLTSLRRVRRSAKAWEKIAKEFPNMIFYLSHSCEYYSMNKKALQARLDIISLYAPHCVAIQNPSGPGLTIPGYMIERHDHHGNMNLKKPYIVSTDGADILSEMNGEAYINHHKDKARITFCWRWLFNCREDGGPAKPPKKRRRMPTRTEHKEVVRLATQS